METKCASCGEIIDWEGNGGHIYPDGQTLCADCEGQITTTELWEE
jgi:hypothetical protein